MADTDKSASYRIGCSGWQYNHWRDNFYPGDLAREKWFGYYAEQFDTVEINNTFYRLPGPDVFDQWRDAAPNGFHYALKYNRYGSHLKKLKDPEDHVEKFLERAERLKAFLGPILVQLPPNWNVNVDRLNEFLQAFPKRVRVAIEFRDSSWLCQDAYDVLRGCETALCIHDMIDDHPREITADWVYLRFHGGDYTKNYSGDEINSIAKEVRNYLNEDVDVFVYFNNDAEGHAPNNARELRSRLS